ncbi:hypothetical protein ACXZ65_37270 [Streptomyces aculeolatus]
MRDEQDGQGPARTELRRRLAEGLARARLNQTQLAGRAKLGRTTVSEALSPRKPVPSQETVAALARALKLPVQEMLELQRTATGESGTVATGGLGRPIGEWEPHDLEVHPAGPGRAASGSDASAVRPLPGYVPREHDRILADAVRDVAAGRSRIVVLVGPSSSGKTRACWEAVQPLAGRGWLLWHPFDPTRADAALEELHRVRPRTVLWLNEAQHYLGDRSAGEQIAAAVHHLLVSPERGPVLVLGTLWPEYAQQYTALPTPGEEDPHSRVRELLADSTLTVPDTFDTQALAAAADLAKGGDQLLGDALTRTRTDGRVTQDLAGAPALLNRYQHATPAAKALLEAAMDARRLGVGLHLPQSFLIDAAPDYLTNTDYDQLTDDWAEQAFAELAALVHGKQSPLCRTIPRPPRRPPAPSGVADTALRPPTGPVFRLADYLEQHGRTTRSRLCPPASFWHAAHTHLTHPDDLRNLTQAAGNRHRLQWAHHLRLRTAEHDDSHALHQPAPESEMVRDKDRAERRTQQVTDHGDTDLLVRTLVMREEPGDRDSAETLARQAADHGNALALRRLAMLRTAAGDWGEATRLMLQAAKHGDPSALSRVAEWLDEAGDREGAERLLEQAFEHGDTFALGRLALWREQAGDREGVERLLEQAAERGEIQTLLNFAWSWQEAGDRDGIERLIRLAADHGHTLVLISLAHRCEDAGDQAGAERLLRLVADQREAISLVVIASFREEAGDRDGADRLAQLGADHGTSLVLINLAQQRLKAGDRDSAECLARQAADQGTEDLTETLATLWPYGLDPDGSPTRPWQPAVSAPLGRLSET